MPVIEVRLRVRLQPGTKHSEIVGFQGEVLRVRVTAPPHEGRANLALIELLADALDIPKSSITIVHGHTSRDKLLAIAGLTMEQVRERLASRPHSH
jgi:uncharacterized protein (TIGR00251 family)